MEYKICSKCNRKLSFTGFYNNPNGKYGKHSHCKKCTNANRVKWGKENPESQKKIQNKVSYKYRLKKRYGITIDQYRSMLKLQDNKCAICNNEEKVIRKNGRVMQLSIDHDHITGKARELLCMACNNVIGRANDSTYILLRAILYLKKHGVK